MDLEQVVDDLTVLDFFKFVPATQLEHARNSTLIALSEEHRSLDFAFHWNGDHEIGRAWRGERYFHANAESLAECVRRLIPLLARESVYLNDEPDVWTQSHLVTIRTVNALLERSGSQERAFGTASGNADIYVLTPALFEYIRQLPLDPVYLPVSDGASR